MRLYLFFLGAVLISALSVGCNRILFGEQTLYSKAYSERAFRQVKQGMTAQEVVSLLGNPLAQTTQQWSEVWVYVPPPSLTNASLEKVGPNVYNLFGRSSNLRFTPEGTVSAASGDYLEGHFLGLTKQQIRARVGEPCRVDLTQSEVVYHYTTAGKGGSGTYKRREVHFDRSGRASSVVAVVYYD